MSPRTPRIALVDGTTAIPGTATALYALPR
jgi:hypothetical protein